MRIRKSFVTNSSSSSFILSFNDDKEWNTYECFAQRCDENDYKEFYNLIEDLKKNEASTDKELALGLLYSYYSRDYKEGLIKSLVKEEDYDNLSDYYSEQIKVENMEWFTEKVRQHTEENEKYMEKKKKIEDADLVIHGVVWDSCGGLLEWAIRNGFIEDNFPWNCVLVWNIG